MRELIPTDLGGLSAEGHAPNKVEKQEGQVHPGEERQAV